MKKDESRKKIMCQRETIRSQRRITGQGEVMRGWWCLLESNEGRVKPLVITPESSHIKARWW